MDADRHAIVKGLIDKAIEACNEAATDGAREKLRILYDTYRDLLKNDYWPHAHRHLPDVNTIPVPPPPRLAQPIASPAVRSSDVPPQPAVDERLLNERRSELRAELDALSQQLEAVKGSADKQFVAQVIGKLQNWTHTYQTTKQLDVLAHVISTVKEQRATLEEDLRGAVRVYARIKGGSGATNGACDVNQQGVFSNVFGSSSVTVDIRDTMRGLMDQMVEHGRNLVLFGYGYSGSGKTYTLFGANNSPGLMQTCLQYLTEDKQCTLQGVTADEFALDYDKSKFSRSKNNQANVDATVEYVTTPFDTDFNKGIYAIVQSIDSVRRQGADQSIKTRSANQSTAYKRTIKWTPNNPSSSRSHLILQATLRNPANQVMQLTVFDLAGREDTAYIYCNIAKIKTNRDAAQAQAARCNPASLQSHLSTLMDNRENLGKTKSENVASDLNEDAKTKMDATNWPLKTRLDYLNALYLESYFIEQTLDALQTYFQRKLAGEDLSVDPLGQPAAAAEMTKILKELDGRGKARFVMICAVHPQDGPCDDATKHVIEFAKKISSASLAGTTKITGGATRRRPRRGGAPTRRA